MLTLYFFSVICWLIIIAEKLVFNQLFLGGLTAYLKIGLKHSVAFCLTDCSGEDT